MEYFRFARAFLMGTAFAACFVMCGTGNRSGGADSGVGAVCPLATIPCGDGCIPQNAVCCSSATTSYCTNQAGLPNGTCIVQSAQQTCRAPSGDVTEFCCNEYNADFASNDCPAGQHHCGLLCSPKPCCPGGLGCPGTTTGAGGDASAGGTGGTGVVDSGPTSLPDPCGVTGNWMTDCPAGATCSGCTNSTSEFTSYYTVSPEIAAHGGTFSAGGTSYSFNVGSCELTASFGVSNACFAGTRTYTRPLARSGSSHAQTFTCFTGTSCTCTGTQTCNDVWLGGAASPGTGGSMGTGGSTGSSGAGGAGGSPNSCLFSCLLTNPPSGTLCCLPSGTCGIDYGAGCTQAEAGTIHK